MSGNDGLVDGLIDDEAVRAAADLVGRTGARELDYGFLHENVPVHLADWWAKATFQDGAITVEHQAGPVEAMEALATRLLTGAQCQNCGGLIALSDEGATAYPGATRPDGKVWTEDEIRAAGLCRWRRRGPRWEADCKGFPPEPGDELHTTEKLARALEALDDPALRDMIKLARRGHYHDFLSPLALPETQLVADLRQAGHEATAQRVIAGDFDASPAEHEAWAVGPDGRAAFADLASAGRPPGRPAGEAFWRTQRDNDR